MGQDGDYSPPVAKKMRKGSAYQKREEELDSVIRKLEVYPEKCLWVTQDKRAENGQTFEKLVYNSKETAFIRCCRDQCKTLPLDQQLMKKPNKTKLKKHTEQHDQIDNNGNMEVQQDILKNIRCAIDPLPYDR